MAFNHVPPTCHGAAVRGRPCLSRSRLCRCHWAAAIMQMPSGVHRRNTPRHVSQPPAASNHQSKTDNIVQPAPAFQLHRFRILTNLPLPDWPCWFCCCWPEPCPSWCCLPPEIDRRTTVHFVGHLFGMGLKLTALDSLRDEKANQFQNTLNIIAERFASFRVQQPGHGPAGDPVRPTTATRRFLLDRNHPAIGNDWLAVAWRIVLPHPANPEILNENDLGRQLPGRYTARKLDTTRREEKWRSEFCVCGAFASRCTKWMISGEAPPKGVP